MNIYLNFYIFLFFFLVKIDFATEVYGLSEGQTVYFTVESQWVGRKSEDYKYKCRIEYGDSFKIIHFFNDDEEKALVEMLDKKFGTRCNQGEQFILPITSFSSIQVTLEEFYAKQYSLVEAHGLFKDQIVNYTATDKWRERVINIIDNRYDYCHVGGRARLKIIGFSENGNETVLVEILDESPSAGSCATGNQFVSPVTALSPL